MPKLRTSNLISIEELIGRFDYDPETGLFKKKLNAGESKKGWFPGSLTSLGYYVLRINGEAYLSHRLAYAIYHGRHPELVIDHINGNTKDNRISNLRQVTQSENLINQRVSSSSTSGYKGVYFNKNHRKWHASARMKKKKYHLGYFDTAYAAHLAYQEFALKNHGDFYAGLERSVLKSKQPKFEGS